MNPMQIKIAVYGGAALLLWLLSRPASATARVSKTLDVDVNVASPYFGMTDAEIATAKAAAAADEKSNPAVNDEMRELIRVSNIAIARDDAEARDGAQ